VLAENGASSRGGDRLALQVLGGGDGRTGQGEYLHHSRRGVVPVRDQPQLGVRLIRLGIEQPGVVTADHVRLAAGHGAVGLLQVLVGLHRHVQVALGEQPVLHGHLQRRVREPRDDRHRDLPAARGLAG
jgi:hypothetical protein